MESRHLAALQSALGIHVAKKLDELGHQPRPASLMAGTQSGPVVGMEVFEEQQVIPPLGIGLELLCTAVDRTPAAFIAQKCTGEAVGDLLADLEEVHHPTRTRRAFNFEVVAIVQVVLQQSLDAWRLLPIPSRLD